MTAPSTAREDVDIVVVMTADSEKRAARLAWAIGMCTLLLLVVSVVLLALDWRAIDSLGTTQFQYFLQAPVVGSLGVLIAARRPRNPIGWLLLAIALVGAVYLVADFVAMRGLISGASPRSWVEWPAWLSGNIGTPGFGALLVAFVILFFPNGRLLPGRRWRWAAYGVFAGGMVLTVSSMLSVSPIQLSARLPGVPNPVAVPALDGLTNVNSPVYYLSPVLLAALVLATLLVRFRRSPRMERRQLRWFAVVAVAAMALVVLGTVGVGGATSAAGFFGIAVLVPAAIGVAIMRYGLYDIDVFISRAVAYGSLAVFITAVYVGIAVGIGTLVGSGGKPNLGLSIVATAIVAIGFQPVRERLQRVANRLVYGRRATPYEVLSQFSGRVAESYASDEVLPRMARVLADGTGGDIAEVWLRGGEWLRRAAAFPVEAPLPAPIQGC